MLVTILRWAGPAFILLGSVMTAANRGARFTGWGFVAFLAGSLSFFAAAALSGEAYGMVMNSMLAATGAYGVYRWLGPKAAGETGASRAERKSAQSSSVPTVISAARLIDAKLLDQAGQHVGVIADFMVAPDREKVAYFVLRLVRAHGETRFFGIKANQIEVQDGELRLTCPLDLCHPLKETDWPASLPSSSTSALEEEADD